MISFNIKAQNCIAILNKTLGGAALAPLNTQGIYADACNVPDISKAYASYVKDSLKFAVEVKNRQILIKKINLVSLLLTTQDSTLKAWYKIRDACNNVDDGVSFWLYQKPIFLRFLNASLKENQQVKDDIISAVTEPNTQVNAIVALINDRTNLLGEIKKELFSQ